MSRCVNCEVLPPALPQTGVIYIAPAHSSTEDKIRDYARSKGLDFSENIPGTLAVNFGAGDLYRLSADLITVLNDVELDDTRALILDRDTQPTMRDFIHVQPLNRQLARARGDWIIDLLNEDRITSYFQPIVSSSDPSNVFAYECLLRGLEGDGKIISPFNMFEAARNAGLLFYLDRAARLSAIGSAHAKGIKNHLFVNFNPTSIYNPSSCLQSTMACINEAGIAPSSLVFEVVESDNIEDSRHLLRILDFYREQGFKVALDDLGSGYGSLNLLSSLKPDFVKLDMKLIRDVDKDSYKAQVAAKLLELAQELNIATIAEGVETEGEWRWVTAHGADYVQGYYFGMPSAEPLAPRVPASLSIA